MSDPHRLSDEHTRRLGPLLGFHPILEARFERETGAARVRQIRQAILVGVVFFNLYSIASIVMLPDIFWLALTLRLGVITPLALGIAWFAGRAPAAWRERAVLAGSIGAAAVPVVLLWASHAPLAAYSAGDLFVSMMFSTMMLALRFPHALIFVGSCMLIAVPSYYLKPGDPPALGHAMVLQLVCAASYLLYGNYRLERNVRSSYLKVTSAVLRSADLELDREALEQLSLVDPLTGVANRRGLTDWLAAWQARGIGDGRVIAVVMIDADHFKSYNDHLGHPAGDLCLQRIAQALCQCMRAEGDLLARYGGEEFVALLADTGPAEAAAVAERICVSIAALRLPHPARGDGVPMVTVSAGAASGIARDPSEARGLFDRADAALYEAKQAGRGSYRLREAPEPVSSRVWERASAV